MKVAGTCAPATPGIIERCARSRTQQEKRRRDRPALACWNPSGHYTSCIQKAMTSNPRRRLVATTAPSTTEPLRFSRQQLCCIFSFLICTVREQIFHMLVSRRRLTVLQLRVIPGGVMTAYESGLLDRLTRVISTSIVPASRRRDHYPRCLGWFSDFAHRGVLDCRSIWLLRSGVSGRLRLTPAE